MSITDVVDAWEFASPGNVAGIVMAFENEEGQPADPTEIEVRVSPPSFRVGLPVTPALSFFLTTGDVIRLFLGTFQYNLDLAESGIYKVRVIATGAIKVASGKFKIVVDSEEEV